MIKPPKQISLSLGLSLLICFVPQAFSASHQPTGGGQTYYVTPQTDDLRQIIKNAPEGSVIDFGAGTYHHANDLEVNRNITLHGEKDAKGNNLATLDGGGTQKEAIFLHHAGGATVENLTIQNYYNTGMRLGYSDKVRILNNRIDYNGHAGSPEKDPYGPDNHGLFIENSKSDVVKGNIIDHNARTGVTVIHGQGLDFEDNQVISNNTGKYDNNWHSGGIKIVDTDNSLFKGNNFSDNYGPGLWTDDGSDNVQVTGNRVDNQKTGTGVIFELSDSCTFTHNEAHGNRDGDVGVSKGLIGNISDNNNGQGGDVKKVFGMHDHPEAYYIQNHITGF